MDVVSDVLRGAQLRTRFFGRWELGAPWALHVPAKATSSLYVVVRGQARLTIADGGNAALSTGDLVILPRGLGHVLDDGSLRKPPSRRHAAALSSAALEESHCLGGDGLRCTLAVGCFSLESAEHPLLRALPVMIHLPVDETRRDSRLAASIELLAAESAGKGPGSELILGRLADIVLVQALRFTRFSEGIAGWPALSDKRISATLELIHERFSEGWTVQSLAGKVGLSRSGLAARFRELVGEPPLHYLTRLRLTHAAEHLRGSEETVESIAQVIGYDSAVAFRKAFKRHHGQTPGQYRRSVGATPSTSISGLS